MALRTRMPIPRQPRLGLHHRPISTNRSYVLTVDGQPTAALPSVAPTLPHHEIGSWALASAAFLLVAMRQSYILPFVPLGLSPARFILFAAAFLFIFTRLAGQHSEYRIGVLGPILTLYLLSTLIAYGA